MQLEAREMAGRIAIIALGSAFVSLGLRVIAALCIAAESGRATASLATNIVVYLSYWPSMTVGFMHDNICSARQLIANSAGWAVLGVLVSLIDLRFRDRS
jgi:hypothetical protein